MSKNEGQSSSTSSTGTKGTAKDSSTKADRAEKIFSDPIHGHIQLPPACIVVIDTPEFQRLRDLKQLGLAYYVFPGAAHNRFEHCLGVCYLAGQFAEYLMNSQPELNITKEDILCVQLAGLVHDLGHGPFSHVFDKSVVKALLGDEKGKWKHEDASKEIFQRIYKNNDKVKITFKRYGLEKNDVNFIKDLIDHPKVVDEKQWPHRWKGEDKTFLYEIVSNAGNKMDVDKWDYIARDCHQLGIKNSFDHSRFMKFVRVIEGDNGRKQICLRDKELINVYCMFASRYLLHKMAYQHKVVCGLDIMVTQALLVAKNDLKFKGCTIPEIIKRKNWEAYTLLSDNILYKIRDYEGDSNNLKTAQKIVERIFMRDFYKCVYESNPFTLENWEEIHGQKILPSEEEIKGKIREIMQHAANNEEIFVQIVYYDLGMDVVNPVEKMLVYSKENPDKSKEINQAEMSQILMSNTCVERKVRIYVSNADNKNAVKNACYTWERSNLPKKLWKDDNVDPSSPSENA